MGKRHDLIKYTITILFQQAMEAEKYLIVIDSVSLYPMNFI